MNNILILLSLLITISTKAMNGSVSEAYAIRNDYKCHSLVFKGRDDYKEVAYIMPRVILQQDQNKQQTSELIKIDDNQFQFRLALYFPNDLTLYPEQGGDIACPDNLILEELKQQGFNLRKVDMLHPYNGSVRIKDLSSQAISLSPSNTDLVDLRGKTKNIVFDLNQNEVLQFQELLKTETGVQIDINLNLTFDQVSSESKKNCSLEASSDESFNQAMQGLLSQALNTINRSIPESNSNGNTSQGSSKSTGLREAVKICRSQSSGEEEFERCVCQRVPNYPACQSNQRAEDADAWGAKLLNSLSKRELTLVINHFKATQKTKIDVKNYSPPREENYSTSFILKDQNSIGDYQEIIINSDVNESSFELQSLNTGNHITLIPNKKVTKETSLKHSPSIYFTPTQLKLPSNSKFFIFTDFQNEFSDCNTKKEPRIKTRLPSIEYLSPKKIKKEKEDSRAYYKPLLFTPYYWGKLQSTIEYRQLRESSIVINHMEDFKELPITISFSNISDRRFSLHDIEQMESHLKLDFDSITKSIKITALKDMGTIKIYNSEKFSQMNYYKNQYFIENNGQRFCSNKSKMMTPPSRLSSMHFYIKYNTKRNFHFNATHSSL